MNLARSIAPAAVLLLTACGSPAASPSNTPVASAEPSDAPSIGPSDRPSASPGSTPVEPSPGPVAEWRQTAAFDTSPATSYAVDVAAWDGGFVAVGSAWDSEFRVNREMPAIWTSSDGESWEAQSVDLGVNDVTLIGVAPRADGRLLLVGRVPGSGANPDQPEPASAAWISADAQAWQAVDLPMADGDVVDSFDHGPKGYALTANGELWWSADGVDWAMAYDGAAGVVAGDEGFVAMIIPEAAGPSSVVASGDGQDWFPSDTIGTPLLEVAALGGDWVATGYSGEPATIRIWHSANGLDWSPGIDVNDLTGPDGPKTGRGLNELAINGASLAGGTEHAFLTLTSNHCCAQMSWNYGVWGSADGMTWEPVVEGDAFVGSVATRADTTVLSGHLGRGNDAAFWIGDR
jgi:hypothetical protein